MLKSVPFRKWKADAVFSFNTCIFLLSVGILENFTFFLIFFFLWLSQHVEGASALWPDELWWGSTLGRGGQGKECTGYSTVLLSGQFLNECCTLWLLLSTDLKISECLSGVRLQFSSLVSVEVTNQDLTWGVTWCFYLVSMFFWLLNGSESF